jgi:aminoglycoside 6'-N-acetyltransferase I
MALRTPGTQCPPKRESLRRHGSGTLPDGSNDSRVSPRFRDSPALGRSARSFKCDPMERVFEVNPALGCQAALRGGPETSMTAARIRVLTPSDLSAWVELRRQLWPHHKFEDLAKDAADLLLTADDGRFRRASMPATVLLAEMSAGRIVGFAEVDLRPYADGCQSSPVGYLEGWYVVPEHRGKNVGRALVLGAEDWARNQGCTEMASDTGLENTDSQKAHHALGYEEVDRMVHFRRPLMKRHL